MSLILEVSEGAEKFFIERNFLYTTKCLSNELFSLIVYKFFLLPVLDKNNSLSRKA